MNFYNNELFYKDNYDPINYQKLNQLNRSVLISPDNKVVYLSIPKCGCTSIKYFLRKYYGDNVQEIKQDVHNNSNSRLIKYTNIINDKTFKYFLTEYKPFILQRQKPMGY